tara:strand:- start:85 stop:255 length:171 start_codon:yes stop_codon:yes gene_type:complete
MKLDKKTTFKRRLQRLYIKCATLVDIAIFFVTFSFVLGGFEKRAREKFKVEKDAAA